MTAGWGTTSTTLDPSVEGEMTVEEAVNKPSVYVELGKDGIERAIYRASAINSCPNALLQARLGYPGSPPSAFLQARFDAGHRHEPLILEKLRVEHDFALYGFQETVEMPVGGTALIRGHVDALCTGGTRIRVHSIDGKLVGQKKKGYWNPATDGEWITPDDIVVVDAKALAQSGYEKWCSGEWKNFPYYEWSQSVYVHGLGAAGIVMAVKNKGKVTREGVELHDPNQMRVSYFTAENLKVRKIDLIRRVKEIEAMFERGVEEVYAKPCPPEAEFSCSYWRSHPPKTKAVQVRDSDGTPSNSVKIVGGQSQIDLYATEYVIAAGEEKAAAARKERAADDIKKMCGQDVAEAKGKSWMVTTYHSNYSWTNWEGLAMGLGMTVEECKEKYQVTLESSKLSVRVGAAK